MYDTKVLKKTGEKLVAYQSTWLVEDTIAVSELELCPRAVLKAPEGKFLTLTVNGVGRQIKPGTYKGDVVLSVTDAYHMEPGGLMRMNQIGRETVSYTHLDVYKRQRLPHAAGVPAHFHPPGGLRGDALSGPQHPAYPLSLIHI